MIAETATKGVNTASWGAGSFKKQERMMRRGVAANTVWTNNVILYSHRSFANNLFSVSNLVLCVDKAFNTGFGLGFEMCDGG